MNKKKILYLITHAGGGHKSAANAIETAIKELRGGGAFSHKIIDLWTLGGKRGQLLGNDIYSPLVRHLPTLHGLLFYALNRPPLFDYGVKLIDDEIREGMEKLLVSEAPDLVVSVHPAGNLVLMNAIKKLNAFGRIKTANIVIELITIHKGWTHCLDFDLTTVPTKEAKMEFLKAGHEDEKIKLIGPVVRPQFLKEFETRDKYRVRENLAPDKFTIMLMGGMVGLGNIYEIVKEINRLDRDIQLIVLASKNKKAMKKLEKSNFKLPMKIFGFTSRVPELMRASDLLITKSGSITLSEALATNLPMIIDSYIPGQESGNPPWIEKMGFGRFITSPRKIALAIDEMIETGKINEYRENIKKFFNPQSTFEIALEILKLLN